jgi:6,7-dimethyl-8-ribityllumazine synthase
MSERDIDTSSENVLSDWARASREEDEPELDEPDVGAPSAVQPVAEGADAGAEPEVDDEPEEDGAPAWGTAGPAVGEAGAAESPDDEASEDEASEDETSVDEASVDEPLVFPVELTHEHAAGELDIPDGYAVLEGAPEGGRRAVGIVVARFNGEVTTRLLARALEELSASGVRQDAITVMVVPGAFELPLAATALAKTRRFACIVALGCVIRGDTPHFDYVASEAASGLQLAALETGVPVSFGVLTLDRVEQAEPRIEKGAEAVRSALEMADLFSHLRAAASR